MMTSTASAPQASPIQGYRPLDAAAIARVNANKVEEEKLLRVLDALAHVGGVDGRWLSIARTHFQEGFMALNRAIMKPSRIALPEDVAFEPEAAPTKET